MTVANSEDSTPDVPRLWVGDDGTFVITERGRISGSCEGEDGRIASWAIENPEILRAVASVDVLGS